MVYQIEFDNDGNGNWLRAHHDFDGIDAEYDSRADAEAAIKDVRSDNPDYDFRIVER